MLSDWELVDAVRNGHMRVDPWPDDPWSSDVVQPSSIDVTLGREFRIFVKHEAVDPRKLPDELTHLIEADPLILEPGGFVLGSTAERLALSRSLAGRLEGKSSLGRLGLIVHSTAGFIDPGFAGHVTLELSNVGRNPIELWPGMKIGQLCVVRLSSPCRRPYGDSILGSRYWGQSGPTASRGVS